MGKIVASVRNQRAPGATSTTLTEDIKFGYTAKAIHIDTFGLLVASAADTFQGVVDELTQVRFSTTTSQPESTMDTDDLFDFMPHIGIPQFITNNALTVDNQPKAFSVTVPFSPFPLDDTRNYGLQPGKGVQLELDWADDTTIDGRAYDVTVEGDSSNLDPIGYMVSKRDAYTSGAVGEENFTTINGNRLLGTMNFQTTEFDALAASAAFNVTGIREQAVQISDNVVLGPYKPYRSWTMNRAFTPSTRSGAAPTGSMLNLGHFFADYGIGNSGAIGLNIAGKQNVKIRTTAGVAEATRVNALLLKK